jgi:hypothetical protein
MTELDARLSGTGTVQWKLNDALAFAALLNTYRVLHV